jgi:hypothetical protein
LKLSLKAKYTKIISNPAKGKIITPPAIKKPIPITLQIKKILPRKRILVAPVRELLGFNRISNFVASNSLTFTI